MENLDLLGEEDSLEDSFENFENPDLFFSSSSSEDEEKKKKERKKLEQKLQRKFDF